MTTRVHLAALVVRDGQIFLVRDGAEWSLPGGELPLGQDDIPREMNYILDQHGISAPSIEGDFLETHYLRGEDGPAVLNLYAPTGWQGDPVAPVGGEGAWFTIDDLNGLPMNSVVRGAVLQAFGVNAGADPAEEAFEAFEQRVLSSYRGERTETPAPQPSPPPPGGADDALDVLRTLTGRSPEEALASLRDRYGEFAGDVLGAIDFAWTSPVLDRKTRSLLVIGIVSAIGGRDRALRSHLEGALNHGATREELVEVVRMVAAYAGFPAAIEVWPVLEEALKRHGMGRGDA